ncbi:MAG TPA: NADP-dependent phosphogluconate dehydrogenase, partial [Streptosporangiaceae bacterium]|nr:NADP-dependent phosphogluconate dehydrogenase [Streptosporangiaceae bacterium]
MAQATAQIGVTGLGVMGRNLARNFARHGYTVALHNRTVSRMTAVIDQFGHEGNFVPAQTAEEFVQALERPRRLVIMVNAGAATDAVIDEFAPLLEEGDMMIDGGNAHFHDTRRREAKLKEQGLHFVGMGVSGGEEGALNGPSIMPGGSQESYQALGPMLETISAHVDGTPCCTHIGPDGAGHFVKMVHNGIEYADMELIAEVYDVLRRGFGYDAARIADVFDEWNQGPLESFLLELSARVLRVRDDKTGKPLVDEVLDVAGQKGTGKWSAQIALDLGVAIPTINAAIDARLISTRKAERVRASTELAGPTPSAGDAARVLATLPQALYAAKLCSYAQGMALIAAGSNEYKWNVDLKEMARIWTGGCIIRARLLEDLMRAFGRDPALPNLLVDADVRAAVARDQAGWRALVA